MTDIDTLESMVDRNGIDEILYMLTMLCCDKAAHHRANWQDEASEALWLQIGKAIDQVHARFSQETH
jgi:hypothetical protein